MQQLTHQSCTALIKQNGLQLDILRLFCEDFFRQLITVNTYKHINLIELMKEKKKKTLFNVKTTTA